MPRLLLNDCKGTTRVCNERRLGRVKCQRSAALVSSARALMRQVSKVGTTTRIAQAKRAARHPTEMTMAGMASPAIPPPNGTPACLMENIRLLFPVGQYHCRTSLPARFALPLLIPLNTHDTQ